MSIKTTVKITRKQAIKTIVDKKVESMKKDLEHLFEKYIFENYTNKELEELLDTKYYNSEFENYSIVEESKGDE